LFRIYTLINVLTEKLFPPGFLISDLLTFGHVT